MTIWIEHDGGLNPVREGETLVSWKLRSGGSVQTNKGSDNSFLTWPHQGTHYDITHYAVTPPRATITPPAPMDAAEVLVRAREAVIGQRCSDEAKAVIRNAKADDCCEIRAILAFHRDLSRPLSDVAPHTVEDADERAAVSDFCVRWGCSSQSDLVRAAIKRGRELERAGKGVR